MDAVLIKLEDPSPRKRGEHRRVGGEEDLALLVGDSQGWLTTEGFIDKVAVNLEKALAQPA